MRLDRELALLLAANAAVLAMALALQMSVRSLMLIYWTQSVIIGVANAIRILRLERWSTEGMKMAAHPLAHSPLAKRSVAVFFLIHYGIFHAVYLLFIVVAGQSDLGHPAAYLLGALAFAASHGASLRRSLASDAAGCPNLHRMMMKPYARIIPMHVMILSGFAFAGSGAWPILVFGVLKTAADVLMHALEHRVAPVSALTPNS